MTSRSPGIFVLLGAALLVASACADPDAAALTERERELVALDPDREVEGIAPGALRLFEAAAAIDTYLEGPEFGGAGKIKEMKDNVEKAGKAVETLEDERKKLRIRLRDEKNPRLAVLRRQLLANLEARLDAEKAKKTAAEKAYHPFRLRDQVLRRHRDAYLKAMKGPAADMVKVETAFLQRDDVRKTRERIEGLSAFYAELAVASASDVARVGDMSVESAKERASAFTIAHAADADFKALRSATARAMDSTMVELHTRWKAATVLALKVEAILAPAFPFEENRHFALIPFKPVDNPDALKGDLELFAARYPGGAVAALLADTSAKHLAENLRDDAKGLAARDLIRLVLNDLDEAYKGEAVDPPLAFRKNLARIYADQSSLRGFAMLVAVVGSFLLFGGLAFAVFRAVRSGKPVELGPTT